MKQTVRLSNDAFYYLLKGEEPLDDSNLEEALSIAAMFPDGFRILNGWKPIAGSGLIECVITSTPTAPTASTTADSQDYDLYMRLTRDMQCQLKWLDSERVRIWWFNRQENTRELRGDFKVYKNKFGLMCFHTGSQDTAFEVGKNSLYFIKEFKKKTVR